jgi:LacI family transcriptional regulator
MATLKDIARNAGVSIGTVSAVLNKKQGVIRVSASTEQKVWQAAKRLNYTPNTIARGLRTGHSFLIGVLISEITSSFVPSLLQGIEEILLESHYGMLLCTYHTPEDMKQKVDFMLQKNIDAAIVLTDAREEYHKHYHKLRSSIPLVCIGRHDLNVDIPRVYTDGFQIGEIAAEYLIKLGHKKIGCIGKSSDRLQGFLSSLKKHKITLDQELQIPECRNFESGKAAIEEFISRRKMPTAVICYSDEIAAGFIAGANKHDIKIPDQISIIGTNDTSIAKMLTPALTTVAQPKAEQGEQAARMALNLIKQLPMKESKIVLNPFLIERESCKAI